LTGFNTEQTTFSPAPFRVRSYEVEKDGKARISSVCNYFQEAAGLHAKQLKFDISDLVKQGLTWILYRLHVKVLRFPGRWEEITVSTWPSGGNEIRAFRDYELWDAKGERIAIGLSQWMMLDTGKKRPVKITPEVMGFGKHAPDHVLPEERSAITEVKNGESKLIATAGLHDLDMNGHVNNVKYIDWSAGFMSPENFAAKKCTEIQIQYTREANAGDKIYLKQESTKKPGMFRHSLYNDNNTLLSKAETCWA
jgi:medium-chain acyl-[acyl-carrier-protein] hydrolase